MTKHTIYFNWCIWFLAERLFINRFQFVPMDNMTSELRRTLIGVPQGSILRPILFSLYINDICIYWSWWHDYLAVSHDAIMFLQRKTHPLIVIIKRRLYSLTISTGTRLAIYVPKIELAKLRIAYNIQAVIERNRIDILSQALNIYTEQKLPEQLGWAQPGPYERVNKLNKKTHYIISVYLILYKITLSVDVMDEHRNKHIETKKRSQ